MIAQAIKRYIENQIPEVKKSRLLSKKSKGILKVKKASKGTKLREQIHTVTRLNKSLRNVYGYVPDKVIRACARLSEKLNKEVFNRYLKEYKHK